ncbi:hypothetical protein NP493_711g03051 [Ridgeia piscesae]|uniref:Centrosomal protein of 19 kDa n=2 Tax=Ridgeia piscesae TaxID=27915 RepID=A0AAD9NPD8_RIDPI|nr:hypothetical protein NP493_711g03051 [Ridgeia piscesae]
MSESIILKKCGVRFTPPALIVTYTNDVGKLHRRTMPLRNFNKNSGVSRIVQEMKENKRHEKYLRHMSPLQLEKLIMILHDRLNGISLDECVMRNKGLDTVDPEEDLNKLDDVTLKRKKEIMDATFEKNRKKREDPDFKYDVEVDFEQGAIESCEWDSDKESDEEF